MIHQCAYVTINLLQELHTKTSYYVLPEMVNLHCAELEFNMKESPHRYQSSQDPCRLTLGLPTAQPMFMRAWALVLVLHLWVCMAQVCRTFELWPPWFSFGVVMLNGLLFW